MFKCFISHCITAETNRVPLQYIDGVENSDYINAVFVHVRTYHSAHTGGKNNGLSTI